MAAQLRPGLPAMTESINFRFLWREDHLSDYNLVICSHQDEQLLPPAVVQQPTTAPAHNFRPKQQPQLVGPAGLKASTQQLRRQRQQQQQACPSSSEPSTGNPDDPPSASCIAPQLFERCCNLRDPAPDCKIKPEGPGMQPAAGASAAAAVGKTRQRKRGAGHSLIASNSNPGTEHAGPTTRSAKRRQQVIIKPESAAADVQDPAPTTPAAVNGSQQRQFSATNEQSWRCKPPACPAEDPKYFCRRSSSSNQPAVEVVDLTDERGLDPAADSGTPAAATVAAAAEDCGRLQQLRLPVRRTAPVTQQARATLLNAAAAGAAVCPAAGPSGTPPPAAAAAAAATPIGQYASIMQQQQQQQQQQSRDLGEPEAGLSMPMPAAVEAAGPSQPAMVIYKELPVHGAVLSAMSEYFRTLIQSWQGADKRLQMVVQDDEALVAEALIEFMYTGELPSVNHDDMLRLMRLSDKFQVKNCPAACARRFAETPMEELSLETVCAIFDWPGFLQDAEPFKGVTAKAWSKLLELFGDLEVAWQDRSRRQQFLELPYKAVRKLIASDDLAVSSENTILAALAEWVEGDKRRQTTSEATFILLGPQPVASYRELAELVRLQHLTPTFLGSVLKHVSVMNQVATAEALQAAARYATGNEATRNKLHYMPNRQQKLKVLYSPPRARSVVQRLEFTWVLELQTVKAMIDQFRNTKVTVDRYSEPHYFNGFQWQLVLQVLEPPAKQPPAGQAAPSAAAAAVDVFVGTTARIQIGGTQHLPDVLYFRGQLAAREVASGDFTFVNRMESGFVCGTAGWGFRNFLRITDWDNEAALRRFFYDGKIHLRCNIDQCE